MPPAAISLYRIVRKLGVSGVGVVCQPDWKLACEARYRHGATCIAGSANETAATTEKERVL